MKTNLYTPRSLSVEQGEYPSWLGLSTQKSCPLRVRGSLPSPKSRPIAMVGTRTPSWNGLLLAKNLVASLVHCDTSVISGLANGIDLACHQAALDLGIHTVAVIAQGIDLPIGGERGRMAKRILESGGAIVSPFADGTHSMKFNFVTRNRIIAAMAVATVIVESREHGGAMYTAADCLDEQRLLLAAPGDILRSTAQGPNALIESESALALWSTSMLPILTQLEMREPTQIHKGQSIHGEQLALWQKFQGECLSIEEITARSKRSLPSLLSILGELEVQGVVQSASQQGYVFSRLTTRSPDVAHGHPSHCHLTRAHRSGSLATRSQRTDEPVPHSKRE